MINFNEFNLKKIFGISKGTEGMKRNQTKFIRAEIFEEAMAEYSNKQLHYVGDSKNGADFVDNDGIFYESKGMDGLFLKTKPMTREITLKNFKGRNKGLPDKTFDYMLLWDTKTYTGGICSWDACMKNTILKDDSVAFRVDFDDITFFAENVEPIDKGDFGKKLYQLIRESI